MDATARYFVNLHTDCLLLGVRSSLNVCSLQPSRQPILTGGHRSELPGAYGGVSRSGERGLVRGVSRLT
jgi:hypothetical protein